ncbi:MAG: class I SAM-dependent methyltransferase [Hyphomicrobiaceae bacterium]
MTSFIPSNPIGRRILYEALHLWSGFNNYSAFNIGYGPVENSIRDDLRFAREPHQIQLYAELIRFTRLTAQDLHAGLLEVGIGGGGGLRYLKSRFTGARITGVDNSVCAVGFARYRGVSARLARADALPFREAEFDCVICVDSFSIFPQRRFVAEARRILRDSGCLVIGDYVEGNAGAVLSQLENIVTGLFTIERFEDVTAGVLIALDADDDRKQKIISTLPGALRTTLAETMSLAGSERHRNWKRGEMCYYMTVLRRKTDTNIDSNA